MNSKNKERMELLKRKSRRNNLVKELSNYIDVSIDSFVEISKNDTFCKDVFQKLSTIQNKYIIQGENYKQNIELSKAHLIKLGKEICFDRDLAQVFFYGDHEIESLMLNIHDVLTNLDIILEKSGFSSGHGDFVLVSDDLSFGICIERTEYFYEFSTWGLSK
ncbi:group-specific protein [Clostridium kluyveri]|uniref:YxiF family protein n=1 Tax=Clostridium kluyveri TaxID=1534 RepID=UPI0022485423|nr:group-specific protein [Clostridium kluyveri]UZQ51680.1 group-specific protein [Clostridium kluyveri]